MSNIREFPGTEEISSKKKIRQKLLKRIRARIYTILFVGILIAGAVTGYVFYEKNKVYTGLDVTERVVFAPATGTKIMEFDGNIMTYSKDGAGARDREGNLLWNITFDMQNPLVAMAGKTVAFADYGGTRIYVQGSDGKGYEVSTDKQVRKLAVSDNGVVAAVLEDTNVTWIYLYNANGETVATFRTTMEKWGYPVDICISPSGEVVGVSYFFLDIGDVKSSVAFYNFGEVGQNNIDNYVSGYNYQDSLVPIVKFLNNDRAFALSSSRLSVYEGAHKPVNIKDALISDDVKAVFYDETHIGVVLANSGSQERYRLEIYSNKGELLHKKNFDFDFSDVVFGNDQFVIYGNDKIYVGTMKGMTKLEMEYDESIRLVIPTSSPTKFIIVTDSAIETVMMQ